MTTSEALQKSDEAIESDCDDVLAALRTAVARPDVPLIVVATMSAAGKLVEELRSYLRGRGEVRAAVADFKAAEKAKAPEGHRHKYGADGRCILSMPGGSGMCTAVSRAAKKAAAGAQAQLPAGGSSS